MIQTKVQQLTKTSANTNGTATATNGITSNGTNGSHKHADISNKTHKSVYIIFVSLLLDLLAFTIILPLLPTILERYRHDDSSGLYVHLSSQIRYFQELLGAPDRYSSVLFGGFLGSMFSFLQFVASPIMGALSDCYGRKPILLFSLVSCTSARFCVSSYFVYYWNIDHGLFLYLFFSLESHVRIFSGQYHRISFCLCWPVLLAA